MMTIMVGFGVVTAGCIVLALLASYLVAPALMVLANKKWHQQERRDSEQSPRPIKEEKKAEAAL